MPITDLGKQKATTKNFFKVQYLAGRAGTVTPGLFYSKACALNHSTMVSHFTAFGCSCHLGRNLSLLEI